jgi:MFS transporter, ACDE family, multidrug resistance protein
VSRPGPGGAPVNPFRQPKGVYAVAFAFACVVSFMGIGLVDPILPALSERLHASPSSVELLFTSYLVVTAVAMLVTGWVSSRIGGKRTVIAGLVLIVAFSAAAGAAGSIGGIIGFRDGWGLGNALAAWPRSAPASWPPVSTCTCRSTWVRPRSPRRSACWPWRTRRSARPSGA